MQISAAIEMFLFFWVHVPPLTHAFRHVSRTHTHTIRRSHRKRPGVKPQLTPREPHLQRASVCVETCRLELHRSRRGRGRRRRRRKRRSVWVDIFIREPLIELEEWLHISFCFDFSAHCPSQHIGYTLLWSPGRVYPWSQPLSHWES